MVVKRQRARDPVMQHEHHEFHCQELQQEPYAHDLRLLPLTSCGSASALPLIWASAFQVRSLRGGDRRSMVALPSLLPTCALAPSRASLPSHAIAVAPGLCHARRLGGKRRFDFRLRLKSLAQDPTKLALTTSTSKSPALAHLAS